MFKTLIGFVLFSLISSAIWANDGLINVKSRFKVAHTADRFKGLVEEKGMQVIKHVMHSQAAERIGIKLKPTELLIFGNAKVGAPLMKCKRSIGIDLPQKLLVWEDDDGQVWMTYNDPVYIADRHQISQECRGNLEKISSALEKFTKIAGDAQ